MRRNRYSVRPGKVPSAFGCIFGGVFVLIGLFVVIPMMGKAGGFGMFFGLFWTAAALFIAVYHGYNASAKRGVVELEIDHESAGFDSNQQDQSVSDRLQELEELKQKNLINTSEYEHKRQEILREL